MNKSINNLPLLPQRLLDETYKGREVIYQGKKYVVSSAVQSKTIYLTLYVPPPKKTILVEFSKIKLV